MLDKFKELLEVRKIIALFVMVLFFVLAIIGKIDGKLIEYVIISIFSFYFGKSTALDVPNQVQDEKTQE